MTTVKIVYNNGNCVDTRIVTNAAQHGYKNGFYVVIASNGNEYMYRNNRIVSIDIIRH